MNIEAELIHTNNTHNFLNDMYYIDLNGNIYPEHLKPILFTSANRGVVKVLKEHAYEVCQTKIPIPYTKWVFNTFKKGFYYKNENGKIIGFCVWKEVYEQLKTGGHRSYLYLLLICAEKGEYKLGSKILFDLEAYCLEKKIESIQLEPIHQKLQEYYEKHGYKVITIKPPYLMEKQIIKNEFILDYDTSSRKTRKVRRN